LVWIRDSVRRSRRVRAPGVLAVILVSSLNACGSGKAAKDITGPTSTDPLTAIVDSIRLTWQMPAIGGAIVTLEGGVTAVAAAGTRRLFRS
jgi:hypothetical protein